MSDRQNSPEQNNPEKRGELIVVCSAKGGLGRTMLAINMAVALCKKRISISLLDGDFQFGDICLAMDIHPTFTIKDVIESEDSLDQYSMASYLNHHQSGVKVLAAPERPEYADMVSIPVLEKVCDHLLKQNDYVIVDTEVGMSEKSLFFIEKADRVLLLANLEMTTLKSTKLMLETLEMLGMRHKVQMVVNEATMESVIQAVEVADILGEEEEPFYIPQHRQIVTQSLNLGLPFVVNQGKTDIAKAVYKMAELLLSKREVSLFKPKPNTIWQSIFSKSKRLKERTE